MNNLEYIEFLDCAHFPEWHGNEPPCWAIIFSIKTSEPNWLPVYEDLKNWCMKNLTSPMVTLWVSNKGYVKVFSEEDYTMIALKFGITGKKSTMLDFLE